MRGIQVRSELTEEWKNRENLRDHMTDLELIFTMLGEAPTAEIARNKDAQGFNQNKWAARAGGEVAGNERKYLEKKQGRKSALDKIILISIKSQSKRKIMTDFRKNTVVSANVW